MKCEKSGLTFDDVARALTRSEFVYAKTMPQCPHHYTLRKKWTQPEDWEAVVQFIRDHGYPERFGKSRFIRLDVNGQKYWSMGAPLPITILINRAEIDRPQPYDAIAGDYVSLWATPEAQAEDRAVMQRLAYQGGAVLDIGCGPGLFLDHHRPDAYLGVDPSREMLRLLAGRHPEARAVPAAFERLYTGERFDLVVGLYGAPSYVPAQGIARVTHFLRPGGRFFLMLYAPHYYPETHRRLGIEPPVHHHSPQAIPDARDVTLTPFGQNYLILEGRRAA